MVSDASTSVFISGACSIRDVYCGAGDHDPEISVRIRFWSRKLDKKALVNAGVISRSPDGEVARGFGEAALNGADVAPTVDAQVRSKLGSVTRRSTEALKSVRVK